MKKKLFSQCCGLKKTVKDEKRTKNTDKKNHYHGNEKKFILDCAPCIVLNSQLSLCKIVLTDIMPEIFFAFLAVFKFNRDRSADRRISLAFAVEMPVLWTVIVFLLWTEKVFSSEEAKDSANSILSNQGGPSETYASEIVKKVIAKGCAKKYTMTCFKMDMVQLVDLLSANNTYQLFPGIALVKDNTSKVATDKKLPDKLIKNLASDFPLGESPRLDEFLIKKIVNFLSTYSVSLRLMEPQNQSLTEEANDAEGRGKGNKGGYGSLMAGVMMMKGTLMTIGFGALAALAGKALMTGLLSLMLSAIIGLRSANGTPQRQTTYEIISKPIYSHSHSHSSELSHDHHEHGHGHSSYSYGRNLDFNDENSYTKSEVEYVQLPAREDEEEESEHPHQSHYNYNNYGNVEYKTITEDDLKAYYNNLDYNNGRGQSSISYRAGKSVKNLEENSKKPLESDSFVPLSVSLKPEYKMLRN